MNFMDGRHRAKAHVKVHRGRVWAAMCGTDSGYVQDRLPASDFAELPADRQCKLCVRALAREGIELV